VGMAACFRELARQADAAGAGCVGERAVRSGAGAVVATGGAGAAAATARGGAGLGSVSGRTAGRWGRSRWLITGALSLSGATTTGAWRWPTTHPEGETALRWGGSQQGLGLDGQVVPEAYESIVGPGAFRKPRAAGGGPPAGHGVGDFDA